tara:strand:- start:561 stop:1208 length:648 start_codon:yes stop_codon:yes gene_type:complete
MANLVIKDASESSKYIKTSGAGSDGDPHITEHLETNSTAIKDAVEGTLVVSNRESVIRKQATFTRASSSVVSISVNGIITASSEEFHEFTTVSSGNGKSVVFRNVKIVTSGGASSSVGNLNVIILSAEPSSTQVEGSAVVLTAAECDTVEAKIACWNKISSTAATVHLSDDSSEYIVKPGVSSRSLYLAIESASTWSVTGDEEFRITFDVYRIEA